MNIQILMPMGGLGSRFVEQGFDTPKPLIPVDGKPMFMRALDSFKPLNKPAHIFVIRKEQVEKYSLDTQIKDFLPDAKINILDHNTRGAVETCMIAADDIDDDSPIIIADCDIYFQSTEYFRKILDKSSDGLLLTFKSNHPRYSYVSINESGIAVKTAEKIVISDNAILGGYYFSSGKLFKELASSFISQPLPTSIKEYFVSHLYNLMIARGLKIRIAAIDKKYIFGTPEELREYNKMSAKT
jgi:NDP-sugar pyrophosphorylase family protein